MPDDPREVLKAAGVECAEVETFYGPGSYADEDDSSVCFEEADAAILALARLVAKYKWQVGATYARGSIKVRDTGKRRGTVVTRCRQT